MKRPNETPEVIRLRSRVQSGRCGEAPDVRVASFFGGSVLSCGRIAPAVQVTLSSDRYLLEDFPNVPHAIRARPLSGCRRRSQSWNGRKQAKAEDGPVKRCIVQRITWMRGLTDCR